MNRLWYAAAVASLVMPALAQAQSARTMGQKQKAWTVANFQTGLNNCSVAHLDDGFALMGGGQVSFAEGEGEGLELAVDQENGAQPTVAAHAINAKGTAGTNRTMQKPCAAAPSQTRNMSGDRSAASVATCSVSGDADAPVLRFAIPLSAFGAGGAAKNYVGHVTLMKRGADVAAQTRYLSKKGYDFYQAKGELAGTRSAGADIEMAVIATCDTSGLSASPGKPTKANYDLAVGTKA